MSLPPWSDVTCARQTEEKRSGKNLSTVLIGVIAIKTETNRVGFWDTEIPRDHLGRFPFRKKPRKFRW